MHCPTCYIQQLFSVLELIKLQQPKVNHIPNACRIWRNAEIRNRLHKIPPTTPILNYTNPPITFPSEALHYPQLYLGLLSGAIQVDRPKLFMQILIPPTRISVSCTLLIVICPVDKPHKPTETLYTARRRTFHIYHNAEETSNHLTALTPLPTPPFSNPLQEGPSCCGYGGWRRSISGSSYRSQKETGLQAPLSYNECAQSADRWSQSMKHKCALPCSNHTHTETYTRRM